MSKYPEDRLSITLPVRFSPKIYQLLEVQAYNQVICNAALVRIAVIEYLKSKGVHIPREMDCWQELEKNSALRKAIAVDAVESQFIQFD